MSADGSMRPDNAVATFLAFLKAQAESYGRALPDRLAHVDALWHSIGSREGGEATWLELERQAHSLAGAGATFNYRELSTAAKRLELAVRHARESGRESCPLSSVSIAYAIHDVHCAAT